MSNIDNLRKDLEHQLTFIHEKGFEQEYFNQTVADLLKKLAETDTNYLILPNCELNKVYELRSIKNERLD